jgi:hypothetical protein
MHPYHRTVALHDLPLLFQSNSAELLRHFTAIYGHLPPATVEPAIRLELTVEDIAQAPLPPPELPLISEEALVSYYGTAERVVIRMPRYALLTVDLAARRISGPVTRNCLTVAGAFEDILLIALAPLYRRHGWFPLHAFAARSPAGQAVLISGAMGAGKTTTGLALLTAGWQLLSNDSPMLRLDGGRVTVLSYPGRLSAYDDSLARFPSLHRFMAGAATAEKRIITPEAAFAAPWAKSGPAAAIFFPQVTANLAASRLVQLPAGQAIVRLIPQAIDGWDKAMIPPHMALLGALVEQVPAYELQLSPDVEQLPALFGSVTEPGAMT